MKDRIFIDSNIFLYAFSDKDKDKQQVAKKIVLNPSLITQTAVVYKKIRLFRKSVVL